MNIYVGNMAYGVSQNELQALFEQYGEVSSANVITDKFTGQSKGFGFVEMPQDDQAQKAVAELNGQELKGRNLTVNEARPRAERPRRNSW
jgi:RNA recognition motif-containing protein